MITVVELMQCGVRLANGQSAQHVQSEGTRVGGGTVMGEITVELRVRGTGRNTGCVIMLRQKIVKMT